MVISFLIPSHPLLLDTVSYYIPIKHTWLFYPYIAGKLPILPPFFQGTPRCHRLALGVVGDACAVLFPAELRAAFPSAPPPWPSFPKRGLTYIYIYTLHIYMSIYQYIFISLYLYTHLYIQTYIYMCLYIYISLYLYIFIHIYIYKYIYICLYIYISLYIYIFTHIYIYTNIYIYIYINVSIYLYIFIFMWFNIIYIYMWMCICICIYIYAYIYTHIYICMCLSKLIVMYIYVYSYQPGSHWICLNVQYTLNSSDSAIYWWDKTTWFYQTFFTASNPWNGRSRLGFQACDPKIDLVIVHCHNMWIQLVLSLILVELHSIL